MSKNNVNRGRRNVLKMAAAGSIAAGLPHILPENLTAQEKSKTTETNIKDALKHPRNENSMPGKYPGKIVRVTDSNCMVDSKSDYNKVYNMLEKSILSLTGKDDLKEAWGDFVSPGEKIGLKVNPVAGKDLSTDLNLVKAIIAQMKSAGINEKDIIIWDRREFQLHDSGFNAENFPGIKITGTERKDSEGSFYDKDGKLYSESIIDKEWYYYADVNGEYDENTMPYMVNGGKYSYFTKIVTQDVDKIINVPILKNAGASVTLALKNLAFGSISNTARLHKPLWSETCAQVNAFPPLRDKVVLNIVDGLKGCYEGGPGANPQFFHNFNLVLIGTDPVAIDRIGYEIVIKKELKRAYKQKNRQGAGYLWSLQKN